MSLARGYTTLAGAQRAAGGRPILRILRDPEDIFIVIPDLATQLHIWTADSPRGPHAFAGSLDAMVIVDAGISGIDKAQIAEWRKHQGEGMISALGEYTPPEFWELLDAYEALISRGGR